MDRDAGCQGKFKHVRSSHQRATSITLPSVVRMWLLDGVGLDSQISWHTPSWNRARILAVLRLPTSPRPVSFECALGAPLTRCAANAKPLSCGS